MARDDLPAHTSATQLSTYASCPRRYAYRYIEHRAAEQRAPGLALGTALHGAIGWYLQERAEEREPALDDVLRIVRADLAAALANDAIRWPVGTTPASLRVEAERLLRLFLSTHGDLAVKELELRFDFVIVDPVSGEQMPRPMIGYFDVELASGNLIELKTAKRAYSATALRAGLQFGAYRTAAAYLGVDVQLLALVRKKQPVVQHVVLPRDRDVSAWFMRAAASIERAILAGHFPPAPGATCPGCEFRRACLGVEAEVADAEAA
ncbi:MAG: PD-(D/E)XK nuclease family protein [Sandaracinus sp.]